MPAPAAIIVLEKAVQEVYGWREVIPTHQGRGAEHILSTILHQASAWSGTRATRSTSRKTCISRPRRCISCGPAAFSGMSSSTRPTTPAADHPFKGNIDLGKLQRLIDDCTARWGNEHGPRHIAYIHLEGCVNMAGGQPFSMENLRGLRALSDRYGIPLLLDATRLVENAYFVQQREPGYRERTIAEIVREMGALTDGCTMSSKKDHLVNIGGFLALNDPERRPWPGNYWSTSKVFPHTAAWRGTAWRRSPREYGNASTTTGSPIGSARPGTSRNCW